MAGETEEEGGGVGDWTKAGGRVIGRRVMIGLHCNTCRVLGESSTVAAGSELFHFSLKQLNAPSESI